MRSEAWGGAPVFTYFSWGDCFCAPGPEEAGMGPGWKAWLGEVVAERALWGEPWADWDGEAEAERCPPEAIWAHVELIYATRALLKPVLCLQYYENKWKVTPTSSRLRGLWMKETQSHQWVRHMDKKSAHMVLRDPKYCCNHEKWL